MALAERARRVKARRHFLDFCVYTWSNFQVRPHRELIASALEQAHARRYKRLMIFTPPQVGKSQLVSRSFPAWWLGRSPDQSIIMTSYGDALATKLSRFARNTLDYPSYKALFGDRSSYEEPVTLSKDSHAVVEWRLALPYLGGVTATGIGGGITGNTGHLAIIDDPIKGAEDARSESVRSKQKDWYQEDLYTRMDPEGAIVICQTRWHVDDLAGWLLSRQESGADLWYVLRLPALAETAEETLEWCKKNYVTPDRLLVGRRDANGTLIAEPWRTD